MAGEVVGRGGSTTSTTTGRANTGGLTKNINDRLNSAGYTGVTSNVNITVDEAIASLSTKQKRQIATVLDKAGFTVRSIGEVDGILSIAFPNLTWSDFPDLLGQIKSQVVVKPEAGNVPSVTITKYGKEQIDNWIDDGLQKTFGRGIKSLTPDELKTLRKAVRDYSSAEAVTTVTTDKKGRRVSTVVPGPTVTGIEQAVETAGMPMFADEAERRKAFEFSNIMSKALGVGSI
jgi:hypothetical protein